MKVHCVDWLKTIIIAPGLQVSSISRGYAPSMPHLPMLAIFCKSHPTVRGRYQFKDFNFDEERRNPSLKFLQVDVALTIALKGNNDGKIAVDALLSWLPQVREDHELARNWRETWNIEYVMKDVKYFAFWPMMNSMYVQDAHARFRRLRNDADELLLPDPQLLVEWLSYAKMWCENGVSNTM